MEENRRDLSYLKLVGILLVSLGTISSIALYRMHLSLTAQFSDWLNAEPMQAQIDLSQPGSISIPFHQTCSSAHGEAIFLDCDFTGVDKVNFKESFAEFSGTIILSDLDNKEVLSAPLNSETAYFLGDEFILTYLDVFPIGDYQATIQISSGAEVLSGNSQRIFAKYMLCGLEALPAEISRILAVLFGIATIATTVLLLPGLLKHGVYKPHSPQSIKNTPLVSY